MGMVFAPLGSGVLYAKSWVTANKQTPTTVTGLNGTTLSAASDTNGSFTGTTVGKKMIINFEKQVKIKGNSISRSPIISLGQVKGSTALANSLFTGTAGSAGGCFGQCYLQATLITAAFVSAQQTWNTLSNLTLGTVINSDEFARVTSNLANGVIAPTGVSLSLNQGANAPLVLAMKPSFGNFDLTFYGLLIEAKVLGSSTAASVTCSSASIVLETFLVGSEQKAPCIILPAK